MTPLVRARLGDDAAFRAWAWHPALRIQYVNSFRRLGERLPGDSASSTSSTPSGPVGPSPPRLCPTSWSPGCSTRRRSGAERREPSAVGVRRRPRRGGAGPDRRVVGAGRGSVAATFAARRLVPSLLADVEQGITGGGYRAAPVLVVVAADTERAHPATVPASIFPAVQNLCLAAQALGLGSALTTLTTTLSAELAAVVALPDTVVAQRWCRRLRGPPTRTASTRAVRRPHLPGPLRRTLVAVARSAVPGPTRPMGRFRPAGWRRRRRRRRGWRRACASRRPRRRTSGSAPWREPGGPRRPPAGRRRAGCRGRARGA